MSTCKNCETEFKGNFCPNCSQSARIHRFTLPHIAHEVVHSVSHLDTGVLYLIRQLAYRPGIVASEYIHGKRKKYFNPITLLLMLLALQVIVSNWTNIYISYQRKLNEISLAKIQQMPLDSAEKQEIAVKKKRENLNKTESQMRKVINSSKLVSLCFLPFLAGLTWLFFRKNGYNYAEHLILNIFLASGILIYFFVFCVPLFLLFPSAVIWIMNLYTILCIIYSLVAYKQIFKSSAVSTIFKGLAVQLISFISVGGIAFLILEFFL